MRKLAGYAAIMGACGILFGAFGAHSIRSQISDHHYQAYRVGIEYLFFHIAPLLYLSMLSESKLLNLSARCFISGVVFFTGSNILMTTESIHHLPVQFLWPVTPIGGVLMLAGWVLMAYDHTRK